MKLLHNISHTILNSNYNTPHQINACDDRLSFDGVYISVWSHRHLLLERKETTILFIMGNYMGGDNSFDQGMPREYYCDYWHILDLVTNYHCEVGFHSWSHRNLTLLSDEEVIKEVTPPFPMKYFAYPYGNVDSRVEEIVRSVGYEDAWSVNQGHGGPFQRRREYL